MQEADPRDFDQKTYCVYSMFDNINKFSEKYSKLEETYSQEYDDLSTEMELHYMENKQPDDEFERKKAFCLDLKNAIQRHCPTWKFDVVPTGSTVNGLGLKDSDLDVAIHIPQAASFFLDEPRSACLNILQIVRRIIENDEEISCRIEDLDEIKLIPAQIQILRLNTSDGIECDISVVTEKFLSSLHNSFLLNHYTRYDHRFAPLCAIVKKWADVTKVKNPKDGGFNSYAIVLLVAHFLQCGTSPPIIPLLCEMYKTVRQEDLFFAVDDKMFPHRLDFGAELPNVEKINENVKKVTKNKSTTAFLFFEFLHYYKYFKFHRDFISMPEGRVKQRTDQVERKKPVYIQDPFDSHNPGRTVKNMLHISKVFERTMELFIPKQGVPFTMPKLADLFNKNTYQGIVD